MMSASCRHYYLDAEDMGACFDELVGEVHVERQVVLGFCRVGNVARVGDGCFNNPCKNVLES